MGFYLDAEGNQQSVAKQSDRYELDLKLTRKQYDNKKLKAKAWHYYVALQFAGRLVSCDFVPKTTNDPSAYDRLDNIFNGESEVPLFARDFEFETDDHEKISGTNFCVFRSFEEYGQTIEFELMLRPSKNSDKALMDFALARFKAKQAAELAASADPATGEVIDNIPETPGKKNKS